MNKGMRQPADRTEDDSFQVGTLLLVGPHTEGFKSGAEV